jgi:hypothetical protein|nr:hypothetical protein [Anaerocolumna aminovalerica]
MLYIVILYALGFFLQTTDPRIYTEFLMLDVEKVLQGQIWRLVTFIILPPGDNILFLAIALFMYYSIGTALENAWGAFRFNLYYFSGILFNILAIVIIYLVTGVSVRMGITYLNNSLFLAFAALFPNVQFLLFYIIPVKVKYLGILYGVVTLHSIYTNFIGGYYFISIGIVVSLLNFLIFFFSSRNFRSVSPNEFKRKAEFKRKVRSAKNTGNVVEFQGRKTITRHKCAICGRTELDDENLEFRFCSKCEGNYEYCMDHLFTHEHVKKPNGD